MTVRAATIDDLPAVLDVWSVADVEPTVTDDGAALRALLARDPAALLVAVEGAQIVGTLIVRWDGWRGAGW